MRVPAWLETALEGGAHELQRALVRYRSLRRNLSGDWRSRASRVAEQCAALARDEARVEQALDRALKRARCDPRAGAAAHLAIAVERERRRVVAALTEVCGEGATLAELLAHLEDVARDESYLEGAWRRFAGERTAWTLGLVAVAAALPVTSWWVASYGGVVPVVFHFGGLLELPLAPPIIAALLALCRVRLGSWSFLGLKLPIGTAAGVSLCVASGLLGVLGSVAGNAGLLTFVLGGLTAIALALLSSMWLVPKKPLLAPLAE